MTELDELQSKVLDLFGRVESSIGDDLSEQRRQLLRRDRESLANSRYPVVVCGEFKRGKSLLLNTLVEQEHLFPVDVDVMTAVVCTLSWAEAPYGVVHFAPDEDTGSPPPPLTIELNQVARYGTEGGRTEGDRDVLRIDLFAPVPQLRSGLVLVDTPGLGSLNPAHTAATRGMLPEADAILFVASALQPLGTVELSFLARAYDQCPIVLTAVTMIDKATEPEVMVDQARHRIAELTGVPSSELDVIGVSALRKWRGLRQSDPELIASSGFPDLEDRLWNGLAATCVMARLTRALNALETSAAEAEAPLRDEAAGLASDANLERIDAELQQQQARAAEQKADGPRRNRRLAEELEQRSRPIRQKLSEGYDVLRDDFQRATEDPTELANPAQLLTGMVERMVDAETDAHRSISEIVDEVAREFSEGLAAPIARTAGALPARNLTLGEAPVTDIPRQRFASFRTIWGGLGAGGGAGYLVGTLVTLAFPPAAFVVLPLSGVLGALAGGTGGALQVKLGAKQRQVSDRRRQLREQVLPRLEAARRNSMESLQQRLRDETRSLTTALDEQLALTKQATDESRSRLQALRMATKEQNDQRRRQIEQRLTEYADSYAALGAVRSSVERLARTPRPDS